MTAEEVKTATNAYIDSIKGEGHEWVAELVRFMRENFPACREECTPEGPMFWAGDKYLGFTAEDKRLKYYTNDIQTVDILEDMLPGVMREGDCVRVRYSRSKALWTLFDACRDIAK